MKTWTKTKVQSLMRHKSGRYYARLYVGDKEKWVSLKTDVFEIAKSRLRSDEMVASVRERQSRGQSLIQGDMTVEEAAKLYRQNLDHKVALEKMKPGTRGYWLSVLTTVQRSWPGLAEAKVADITKERCQKWATEYRSEQSLRDGRIREGERRLSSGYFNNSLSVLKSIFQFAVAAGHLNRNPAAALERARIRQRKLELPTRVQFRNLIAKVRGGKHRTSEAAANLLEFLAYSGCRIGEARRVTWGDINFAENKVNVLGDADTGTKNWSTRTVPMIRQMKRLLQRMAKSRLTLDASEPLHKVKEIRGALQRACNEAGIKPIRHHDLRHLFATVSLESSVSAPTLAGWLGHRDGGALALRTYSHLRADHSQDAAKKVSF